MPKSTFFNFIVLLFVVGFPRIYGTEYPLALLVAPFYLSSFLVLVNRKPVLWFGFFFVFSMALFQGTIAFAFSSGVMSDLYFHFVIYVKIILLIYFSFVIYCVLRRSFSSLLLWLIFQFSVIFISAMNYEFYSLMLGFISPRSAEIFQHIFGLRALGFGLFHMDGALTLIFAFFLYFLMTRKSVMNYFLMFIVFPFSMMVARSAIIPYVMFFLTKKGFFIKLLFFLSLISMFFLSFIFEGGPAFQALELFRNIVSGEGAHVDSVAHLQNMLTLPDEISTYIIGDGRYYGDLSDGLTFYMSTDIGYLRIMYYSGFLGLALFSLSNLYLLIYGLSKRRKLPSEYTTYLMVSIIIFFIINAKGIQTVPIFSFVMVYFVLDHLYFNQIKSNHS